MNSCCMDSMPESFVQKAIAIASQCGMAPSPTGGVSCLSSRRGTIGSALTAIPSGSTVTIRITVRKGTFVGHNLKVSKAALVNGLLISDVRVGGDSIMLGSSPIGTEVSDPANKPGGVVLPFLPAPVSQVIEVDLTNTDAADTVTGATNANPIVVTTAAAHGLATGDEVIIAGVTGNTAANGTNKATVVSPTTFSIPVAGNGAYGAGGTVSQNLYRIVHIEGVML